MKTGTHNIGRDINDNGYAHLTAALNHRQCDQIRNLYDCESQFRKTINMEQYRFGKGQYKYLKYPLPDLIQQLRRDLYEVLYPIANTWNEVLRQQIVYPDNLNSFLDECHANGQSRPTPLLLRYTESCYNTLHQDIYGDVYFPLQAIVSLSDPVQDYSGGQLILTEQRPRAQSKGIVITPQKGDVIIIPTRYRPIKGAKGYYRVNMRHGVAEVTRGERHTLGIIFHDAL